MSTILKVEGVNHKIKNKVILEDINFTVAESEIVGLFGPNGVGKSTLLRRIANCEETKGTITINDIANDFTKFRTDVMLITSELEIPRLMSLHDYCKLLSISFEVDFEFVNCYAEKLGINITDNISSLSKGHKEMAQLIASLATDCQLLLLDEPFSAIDIYKRDIILQMIIESKLNGKTIIITTHLIDDIAEIIDKALYIHDCKIEFYLDTEEIQEQTESIAEYLKSRFGEA